MSLRLVRPSARYKRSYLDALRETMKGNKYRKCLQHEASNLSLYLKRYRRASAGQGLKRGEVPVATFWLVDQKHYIGMIQIRHKARGRTHDIKSNVYYEIRPTERSKGYGTKILALGLKKAKQLGLRSLIITCNSINRASRKIIEHSGGILKRSVYLNKTGEHILVYTRPLP